MNWSERSGVPAGGATEDGRITIVKYKFNPAGRGVLKQLYFSCRRKQFSD
jgi:hypothetical protein